VSGLELQAIAIAMILTLATPLIGSRRWFPHNRFGTLVLFLAGVAIGAALYRGNVPPKWFNGSSWGFTIALTLMASAFGFKTAEERFYRLPWLFGFGATLLVCNIWAKVA
jgi:hypothetical protein